MDENSHIFSFQEMLHAGFGISTTTYNILGESLQTNCREALAIDRIFTFTTCKQYLLDHVATDRKPMILSAPLGMKWAAVTEQDIETEKTLYLHIIGPILTDSVSVKKAYDRIYYFNPDLADLWGKEFADLVQTMPVVPFTDLQRLALMLHYYMNSEPLYIEDILYQEIIPSDEAFSPQSEEEQDLEWNWMEERELLSVIRTGNINNKPGKLHLDHFINLLHRRRHHSLSQSKYTAVSLITICTRACIEGGFPVEAASQLEKFYLQGIDDSHSVSELAVTIRNMYEDYVHRVYKLHDHPELSKPILSCCTYIKQHVEEPLSVALLAGKLGYANYYLTQKFKQETGQNLRDYIREAKIERAIFLLANSNIPIQVISDTLCFSNRSYFSEVFKKVTAMTPGEYREKYNVSL